MGKNLTENDGAQEQRCTSCLRRALPVSVGAVFLMTVLATFAKYRLGADALNNLLIFRASSDHLLRHAPLYAPYPQEYHDLFKYSPTFALFFVPFAALPLWWSALAWNLMNAGALLIALIRAPLPALLRFSPAAAFTEASCVQTSSAFRAHPNTLAVWLVIVELCTSLQNFQSNGLLAALVLTSWTALEHNKPAHAALLLAAAFHIKIYGVVAALCGLLYPDKWRFYGALSICIVLFAFFPILVCSPGELLQHYGDWHALVESDHAHSSGVSVLGILESLQKAINVPDRMQHTFFIALVQAASFIALCAPIILLGGIALNFPSLLPLSARGLCFASVLLWMTLFNHKAESPTYILAMTGVAVWFAADNLTSRRTLALLCALALVGTSLSVTDIIPAYIQEQCLRPLRVKVLPCLLIWCVVQRVLFLHWRDARYRSSS